MPTRKIKIYNTLSGKKDAIVPRSGKKINLFVCGPTVYDFPHIGHARTYVIFDCFAKYLRFAGYHVFYLQNITDVDDKIIAKAREKGVPPKDLAEAFLKEHLKDMKLLGITSVKKYARATLHIKEIIGQIARLAEKGYAYKLDDGIYFDIGKFKAYGKLSGRTALQAEDAVSRIDYSANKKNRGDFCLWKFGDGHDGEPNWPSPFGNGRPGWHIEDTAITEKFFGAQYDIHGGGRDLIFPHHEAEIAQMEAISEKSPLAGYWMHTGFLTINEQKMSKSLNNSITISAFLNRYSTAQLRFWIAKNLWHAPMNYSDSTMIEVKASLERIEEFLRKIKNQKSAAKLQQAKSAAALLENAREDFYASLDDDFNTPKAFAVLFDFIKEANILLDQQAKNGQIFIGKKTAGEIQKFFKHINDIFGIIDIKKLNRPNIPAEVKILFEARQQARQAMDFAEADRLRLEIEKYGYTVQDSKDGSTLKKNL